MPRRLLLVDLLGHGDLPVYLEGIRDGGYAVDIETASTRKEALEKCGDCSILMIGDPVIDQALVDRMPRLEWIHVFTSGTNRATALNFGERARPIISSSRGIHGPQMAELTMLHMLSASRDFPRVLDNAKLERWERWVPLMLAGRSVLILGVGFIAEALAARCKSFEMTVIGMSASRTEAPGFDSIVSRTQMDTPLASADFVVVLLPYNADNHLFVDQAFMQRMKRGSILINVSRGSIVDEEALLRLVGTGHIRHAGLDVFATEPLPSGSALWSAPGITVTPHVGGMSDRYAKQALPLLLGNLAAFLTGRPSDMSNIVA